MKLKLRLRLRLRMFAIKQAMKCVYRRDKAEEVMRYLQVSGVFRAAFVADEYVAREKGGNLRERVITAASDSSGSCGPAWLER